MKKEVTLVFNAKRETKGTVLYEEQERPNEPIVVGALYIRKHFASGTKKIKVTITTME